MTDCGCADDEMFCHSAECPRAKLLFNPPKTVTVDNVVYVNSFKDYGRLPQLEDGE